MVSTTTTVELGMRPVTVTVPSLPVVYLPRTVPLPSFRGNSVPGTGFPLGFWFAQQGAIYVFVALIFVYVFLMNRLDREFDLREEDDV